MCALSYAHYWAVTGGNDWISLPLLSCRRDEFVLRTEAIEVFSQVGVQSDCLIFADDLPLDKLKFTECLEVTLVDHNHSSSRLPSNSVVQGTCVYMLHGKISLFPKWIDHLQCLQSMKLCY